MFVQESWYTGATPDGRRWREPIAPHFSPVPGRADKGPTAILNSAAKTELSPFIGNAPVYFALSRSVLPEGKAGENTVRAIFDAAAEKRMVCVNLAIHDVEEMRRAQKDPASYGDLIVRVWGYSARFVDLTPEMQEHIIARTAGI
jgi:formate C-acetyltransferase